MKKLCLVLLTLVFAVVVGVGCAPTSSESPKPGDEGSASGNNSEKIKLVLYSTAKDQILRDTFKAIVSDFEKEHANTKVEVNFPGNDYENILKVKMAANELPDVFDTHGWAIKRYGNYLTDLRDEKWASQLSPGIKPIITDDKGKVYVLPLNEDKAGMTYNADLLKKYNIEVPRTFDELVAAAEKIKKESNGKITPFYFAGNDSWTFGYFYNYFSNPLLIAPSKNFAQDLLNGTFDWSHYAELAKRYLELKNKGLINEDAVTAKYQDALQLFAQNELAFTQFPISFVNEVKKLNPDIKTGFMPYPSFSKDVDPVFVGGELYTMGVWKDSKHIKESKELVNFFAKPENIKKIAEISNVPAGLNNINANLEFAPYYEKYKDIRVLPVFDRIYLPNGMWDVIKTNAVELAAGTITPEAFAKSMEVEFKRLRSQIK